MEGYSDATIALITAGIAVGTWAVRFSFIGLIGARELPPWLLRHLRYTPVAVIPALVAPLVLWPGATGGAPDPARLVAALAAFAVGFLARSVLGAILVGMGTFYAIRLVL
ncbi:MAG: AzlD domain-containing protein [Pseudomonadota bacterium]